MKTIFAALLLFSAPALAGNATYIKGPTLIESFTTTATAAGTTTLTVSSNSVQQFTGSTTQNVVLPSGTTLANGRSFKILNASTGALTLKDNGANTLATIPADSEARVFLISNGTSNGTWDYRLFGAISVARGGTGATSLTANNVILGNGTSAVQFVAPGTSGNVLTSNGTTWASTAPGVGSQTLDVKSKTTTYTAAATDTVLLVDASGGAWTLTLPAAASNTGHIFYIKKTDSSVNAVTVDGNASETIDGTTTKTVSFQYEAIMIVSDGTNWVKL